MSKTETTVGDPTETNSNIRLTGTCLEDIDATWREEGYNSRGEFLRDALRDAVCHPGLTREGWSGIAAVEHARRSGDSETVSREISSVTRGGAGSSERRSTAYRTDDD
ncbi:MAG: ribbon-helix-helix domain-containing protein [Halapricum sp.]